jgi:O-antigen/teichoic acid export membrane protein
MKKLEATTLGQDSIRTLVFSLGQSVFAALTGIAVAKAIGPAGKGEYALLQLFQAAASGVTGNLGLSITYELTRQRKPFAELVRPLTVLLAILSLIEWALVGVWIWVKGPEPAPLLFAASAPALIVLSWQSPIFLGLGWIRSLNVQGLAFAIGTFAAAVITLYVFHFGTIGAMWGWVASVWAIAISTLVRTAPVAHGEQTDKTMTIVGRLMHFGIRAGAGGIFGFINSRIASVIVVSMAGTAALGIFSVAVSAGEVLLKISRSVAQAATKRVGSSKREIAAATVAKSNRASTALIVSSGTLAFILAPWLVDTLYGPNFHEASVALRILLPGIAALSCAGILSTFFNYQMGRPIFLVFTSVMNSVIVTGLCLILVPRFGMVGAAWSCTITYLNAAAVTTWYFCKHSGMSAFEVWIPKVEDVTTILKTLRKPGVVTPSSPD